jgi:uncharacterized membrane protein YfcA
MDYLIVTTSALLVAIMTFFAGFGLGTLLMPVFAIFFPLEVAIAATGVVHFLNNLFKLTLVGKDAHWPTVWRYGITAAIASILGAGVLELLGHPLPLASYQISGHRCDVTVIKLVVAAVIAGFAVLELSPRFDRASFDRKWLWLGGILSGFFGGLSGHQGALRSAFLIRAGLTKEQLVATRVVGAVIVDASRLFVYAAAWVLVAGSGGDSLRALRQGGGIGLVIAATLAAFIGSFLGTRLIRKVTLQWLKRAIGVLLLAMAAALGAGLI